MQDVERRRQRKHAAGDHSECLPTNRKGKACRVAQAELTEQQRLADRKALDDLQGIPNDDDLEVDAVNRLRARMYLRGGWNV
jgi:hypothetical protein